MKQAALNSLPMSMPMTRVWSADPLAFLQLFAILFVMHGRYSSC